MVAQVAALDHACAFSALTLVGTRPVAPGPVDDDLPDHNGATMDRQRTRPTPPRRIRAGPAGQPHLITPRHHHPQPHSPPRGDHPQRHVPAHHLRDHRPAVLPAALRSPQPHNRPSRRRPGLSHHRPVGRQPRRLLHHHRRLPTRPRPAMVPAPTHRHRPRQPPRHHPHLPPTPGHHRPTTVADRHPRRRLHHRTLTTDDTSVATRALEPGVDPTNVGSVLRVVRRPGMVTVG